MNAGGDEGLLAKVLEAASTPILSTDGAGVIRTANVAASQFLHRTVDALIGESLASVLRLPRREVPGRADERSRFEEIVAPARAQHAPVDRSLRECGSHATSIAASIRGLDPADPSAGWVFTLAPRSPSGDSMRLQMRSRLFDLSLDLLATIGEDGYFIDTNPAWSALGFEAETLGTMGVLDVVHPDDQDRVVQELVALRSEKPFVVGFTCRIVQADGGFRWYRWMAVNDTIHDVITGIGVDITNERLGVDQLQRMVRSSQEREKLLSVEKQIADEANRLKTEFLASMSHELRTPLNSVIGFAGLLLDDPDDEVTARTRSYIERIHRNGIHLLGLIEDVLEIGESESTLPSNVEHVDLQAVVAEAVLQSGGAAAIAHVDLDHAVPDGLQPIEANSRRLVQVLINLIGNAIKYARAGRVLVTVVPTPGTDRAERIDVVDEGPGIPAAEYEAVFEPFRRGSASSDRGSGSGLGLTISRSMCLAMGFELLVDSVVGDGATFSVLLVDTASQPVHVPIRELQADEPTRS